MTNQVSHFYFEHHFSVRTVLIDGEPWFIAKDVCDALQIVQAASATRALDDDEKGMHSMHTLSGRQKMAIINESGLYTLILRCRDAVKPGTASHRFRKWITNEVLPTIRKTGHYAHPVCNKPKAEPLTPSDMGNLNHLVTLMSMSFKRQSTWSRGIWYALRRASGVPSPQPFTVNDLPALSEECRRIIKITATVNEMISRIEKEAVRRILRNREECEQVVGQLQREFDSCGLDAVGRRNLERFEQLALAKLEKRIAA